VGSQRLTFFVFLLSPGVLSTIRELWAGNGWPGIVFCFGEFVMRKKLLLLVVVASLLASLVLPGCSTGRGAVALLGGRGKDKKQRSNYILQHTAEDNYDQGYRGQRNPGGGR